MYKCLNCGFKFLNPGWKYIETRDPILDRSKSFKKFQMRTKILGVKKVRLKSERVIEIMQKYFKLNKWYKVEAFLETMDKALPQIREEALQGKISFSVLQRVHRIKEIAEETPYSYIVLKPRRREKE